MLLNSFVTVLVVIAGWSVIDSRVGQYYGAFLIMSGLLNGVFAALDALLFYVFFEGTLIPMFIIIGVWGGPNRVYAAVKFFLYTLLGSLLMLVAMLYLYNKSGGSFSILDWHKLPLALGVQTLLFFGFLFAFAVKVPMWPVHTWLPDAHTEAPTGGSVVLAAILLKLGAYGFVRFSLPILPDASRELAWLMIGLSLVAIAYIGLVTLVQTDMKRLIAYSSISHMGFVTLGFFIFNAYGVEGGLVQMISHGFVSAALFLCVGVMYDRMHTRKIGDYGGVVNTMPKFAAFMMLFAMANAGLPATSGFVGEFMVIMGAMKANFWLAFVAATTLISRRGLHAVDVQARDLRRRGERPCPRPEGFESAGIRGAGGARRRGAAHGRLSAAVHRSDARLGRTSCCATLRRRSYDMTSMEFIKHLQALPEGLLLVGTCVAMLVDVHSKDALRRLTYYIAQGTLALCFLSTLFILRESEGMRTLLFNGLFVSDALGHVLKLVCYAAVSAALVYSRQYLLDRGLLRGEFITLLLFCLLGMMVMISAASFLTLFLGLELMSLCLYALVALNRDSALSTEAAMKYFVLGALSSGLLLYGMSMIYGATGTLNIYEVAGHASRLAASASERTFLVFGLVFLVAGLAFKIGVAPFHMWIPDVYHGAPTAVTLIVGTAPKLAAFAMAVRLLVNGVPDLAHDWQQMLVLLAVLSMAIGNIAAIAQANLKRMLAYSTIAHMGFMLLGLLSGVVERQPAERARGLLAPRCST